MDWFAWLAQTSLHPSLVYSYGVLFACNDLTLDDVVYFDHQFLLSMGVSIAKHRLEILKLAHPKPKIKTHRFIPKLLESLKKLGRKTASSESPKLGRGLSPLKVEWKEIKEEDRRPLDHDDGFRFSNSPRGQKTGRLVGPIPSLGPRKYVSGPINGGRPAAARSPRLSGPLSFSKVPNSPGPVNGNYAPEAHSPWAMLFEDLKPN